MNLDIMRGGDRKREGIPNGKIIGEFDRANLDHFENEAVAYLPVGGALPGDGLIPLQVQDDIMQNGGLLWKVLCWARKEYNRKKKILKAQIKTQEVVDKNVKEL